MIKILAPQTRDEVDAGASIVLEMDREAMLGIRAAVEIAYDDADSVPAEFKDVASELWQFFAAGRQIDGDVPFLP